MIRKSLIFLLLSNLGLIFVIPSITAADPVKYYIIDGQHEDNGIIKIWYTALGLLDEYDQGKNAGFEISFESDGKHYNAESGSNWWDYYFTFHSVGSFEQCPIVRIPRYKRSIIRFKTACTMTPERGNFLINKYMHLQPALKTRFEQIRQDYWPQNIPVVGIYYQKPIMPEAQASWDPISLSNRVKEEMKNTGDCKFILFTDLDDFANGFFAEFGSNCVRIPSLIKSKFSSPAECGENELLTLLLLGQCDIVIAPGSYHGIGAKMFNPNLQLIQIDAFPYAIK